MYFEFFKEVLFMLLIIIFNWHEYWAKIQTFIHQKVPILVLITCVLLFSSCYILLQTRYSLLTFQFTKTMRMATAERDEMYTCIKNYPERDEMYTCVEKIDEVTAFRFFSPADWSQSYRFRRFWRQVFCFETDGDNSCYRHTKWTILSNWKLV